MEITLFSKCIKELIVENDRVDVPYLGTFTAAMMPASYSDRQNTIHPPYRKISFHKQEVSLSEGRLLLRKVAQEAGVSDEQAAVELGWCLSRVSSELEGSKICRLPGLGVMRANGRNEFYFVPDDDLDIWPDGLGLEPVSIKVNEKKEETKPAEAAEVAETVETAYVTEAAEAAEAAEVISDGEHFSCEKAEITEQPERPEQPALTEQPGPARRKPLPAWAIVLIVVGALLVLFVAACYLFTDAMSPVLDRLLYSKEELELLRGN